jgi:hypothetical protein
MLRGSDYVPVVVPDELEADPGHVEELFGKHMLIVVSQHQVVLDGLHVFWQSASMLHVPMQPELDPVVEPLVVVPEPPPLVVDPEPPPLVVVPEPPPDELTFPVPVPVEVLAPVPAAPLSLLPEAQATPTTAQK